MRKWVKVGLWSLAGTLVVSSGLILASKLYFDSKHQNNNPTQQPTNLVVTLT